MPVPLALVETDQSTCQFGSFFTSKVDGGGGSTPGWGYPHRPDGTAVAQATGRVFGIAMNTSLKRIWWKNLTDAGSWGGSGDPSLGTGGNDFSAASATSPVTGLIYPTFGADCGDQPLNTFTHFGSGTVNFGATAFSGTAPTGAISPYSVYPSAALNNSDRSSKITVSGSNLTFTCNTSQGPGNGDPYSFVRANFAFFQSP